MSESVLKGIIADSKNTTICWEVDSAALADWNVGYPPENRCLKVLSEHQLDSNHIGRQVRFISIHILLLQLLTFRSISDY